jgi:hypothetical protein
MLFPHDTRYHAEHGTAIQLELSVGDDVEGPLATFHDLLPADE